MGANKNRISLREGKVFLDGIKVIDAQKLSIKFKPDVATSRALGERGTSRRYLGYDIGIDMTKYKSNPWLKEAAKEYIKTGKTPEFVITGIQDDKNADCYAEYGSETVTCNGCVLTGDISIMELDTGGEYATDTVTFGATEMV